MTAQWLSNLVEMSSHRAEKRALEPTRSSDRPTPGRSSVQERFRVRALESFGSPAFKVRRLGDTGMANPYEQPVSRAWIVVLVAVVLPAFGGLYYALLDFLLFG
jgi:hypothetical protein